MEDFTAARHVTRSDISGRFDCICGDGARRRPRHKTIAAEEESSRWRSGGWQRVQSYG